MSHVFYIEGRGVTSRGGFILHIHMLVYSGLEKGGDVINSKEKFSAIISLGHCFICCSKFHD